MGSSDRFTKVRGAALVGISLILQLTRGKAFPSGERALIRSVMLELCRKIQFKDFYGKFGYVCCSLACSIYETVQSAFAVNDLAVLQDCWADLGRKSLKSTLYRRVRLNSC